MSPDLTVGHQQQNVERSTSPIPKPALSPVCSAVQPQDRTVTPPPSSDQCCAPDGTRATPMSQTHDDSLAFEGMPPACAEDPLSSVQPERSSREASICAKGNEPTKQPLAPAKNLYAVEDSTLSSDEDGPVVRGMSPASFQSQEELSSIPDHSRPTALQSASSESFSFVMPVYRGAMEYTSSGEVSPLDPMEATYWDDLGDPALMTPLLLEAVDTVPQLDETITTPSLTRVDTYVADDIARGIDEVAAAAPPCDSANLYQPLVSDIHRQSKQGESVR